MEKEEADKGKTQGETFYQKLILYKPLILL